MNNLPNRLYTLGIYFKVLDNSLLGKQQVL